MGIITPEGGKFAAIPVFNQLVPNEGPRSISFNMDFTAADAYEFDLQIEIAEKIIWGVQGCYFNNKLNNADVSLVNSVSDQEITFPAGFQGYLPLLYSKPPKGVFSCAGGNGVFNVKMLNIPMPAIIWDAR